MENRKKPAETWTLVAHQGRAAGTLCASGTWHNVSGCHHVSSAVVLLLLPVVTFTVHNYNEKYNHGSCCHVSCFVIDLLHEGYPFCLNKINDEQDNDP